MATQTKNRNRKLTARELALEVLLAVEEQSAYSNLALQSALSKHTMSAKDTGLVTEMVYGTVQRLNTIDYRIQPLLKQPMQKLDPWVRNLLRVSVYQLVYLERVPDFAVLNEAVEIAKRRNQRLSGFVNGVLRSFTRSQEIKFPSLAKDPIRHISLVYSHPEWLVKDWIDQYGIEQTVEICRANNDRPSLSLRVNRLRATREEVVASLAEQGIEAHVSDISPDGIVLSSGMDVTKLEAFQHGLCTVQDESSMLVTPCLAPKPGMRILDACAAPGGKTTHLAETMNDQGEIVAADIYEHKVELIRNATHRLGIQSVKPVAGDIRDILPELGEFDAILLDAPCSGFGVIRRKPDIKWRKTADDVSAIQAAQAELIRLTADALKPGGILVYSTCTIGQKENQEIVRTFLEEHANFQIEPVQSYLSETVVNHCVSAEGWVQILPQHYGTDGFFICRLRKM